MLFSQRRRGAKPQKPSQRPTPLTGTRSLTDRASDYGSEGCRFESCRVHSSPKGPRRNPGALSRGAVREAHRWPGRLMSRAVGFRGHLARPWVCTPHARRSGGPADGALTGWWRAVPGRPGALCRRSGVETAREGAMGDHPPPPWPVGLARRPLCPAWNSRRCGPGHLATAACWSFGPDVGGPSSGAGDNSVGARMIRVFRTSTGPWNRPSRTYRRQRSCPARICRLRR